MTDYADLDAWDRDAEAARVIAEAWIAEADRRITASAAPAGPWGDQHPVSWAYRSGRLAASGVPDWGHRYDADPQAVAATLPILAPVLAPNGTPIAAGTDYGVASTVPTLSASPARGTARNAVEELRADSPGLVAAAERGGPPPRMFIPGGDLPVDTASGISVAVIAALPWRARIAAAWAKDRIAAMQIAHDFGDELGEVASRMELDRHPAVIEYVSRVNAWAATSGMDSGEPMTEAEVNDLFNRPNH